MKERTGKRILTAVFAVMMFLNCGVVSMAEEMPVVHSACLGEYHSALIDENGDLYTWGWNGWGQLGNGTSVDEQLIPLKILSEVASVSLGKSHSAAITWDGSLYMWGNNGYGQLGTGQSSVYNNSPVKVLSDVVAVSLGYDHSAAITEDGSLYLWGDNGCGQIGNGKTEHQDTPVKVLSNVVSVSLGGYHSAAITTKGDLYTWGLNEFGQLGDGTIESRLTPTKVLSNVWKVSLGYESSAAITKDGNLYMWGDNWQGQLGDGTTTDLYEPTKIMSDVAEISLGEAHSAAVKEDGSLYLWGVNSSGELGNGNYDNQLTPVKILSNIEKCEVGVGHSAAITKSGEFYIWGKNEKGQIGNGNRENQNKPLKLTEIMELTETAIPRVAGSTRYETSLETADALREELGIDKFDTVILADGRNFPDALAGSYLAGKLNAPILMANEKAQYAEPLRKYIRNYLKSDGIIYVLGGTSAVPSGILEGLSGYSVKRLAGDDRYETNLMILEEAGVKDEDILVCTGKGFADSLSASATGRPILLVSDQGLTAEQYAFLAEHNVNRYYIIGGESAVNQSTEATVQEYAITKRVAGDNRYETSVKVAEEFFDHPKSVVLAYAKNFPDGLCGGPLAMSMDAPLILTAEGKIKEAKKYVNAENIESGKVLGGEDLISNGAVDGIF